MNHNPLRYAFILLVVVGCGQSAKWQRYEGVAVSVEMPAEPVVASKSTGVTRVAAKGTFSEIAKQMREFPDKKVSHFNERDRVQSKDHWTMILKYGQIGFKVTEDFDAIFSDDDIQADLKSVADFLEQQLGENVTVNKIQLDGIQATSFEYALADFATTTTTKVSKDNFVTRVEAYNKGYHLSVVISGYSESQRKSIRDRLLESIKWDGTVISTLEGSREWKIQKEKSANQSKG